MYLEGGASGRQAPPADQARVLSGHQLVSVQKHILISIKRLNFLQKGDKIMSTTQDEIDGIPAARTRSWHERFAIEHLRKEGWRLYTRGWPDLLCLKDDKLMCVEVKPAKRARTPRMKLVQSSKYVDPIQRIVHQALRQAGIDVKVMTVAPLQTRVKKEWDEYINLK